MITIVNYGLGNLGSIANMLERIGAEFEITSERENILKASKILLPGVGAFDAAMNKIRESGLEDLLKSRAVNDKVPFMGICLGMQLLMDKSEEGNQAGLSLVKGDVLKLRFEDRSIKIPHMGWNVVKFLRPSPLTQGMLGEQRFYFVHSYRVVCDDPDDVVGITNYGCDFASIIQHQNIYGGQFHPEKSHRFGMALLENFAKL